ncbi:hypothetical protein [Lactobacillus agrestimuris]|uniref:hypothetical protein n=1 Tax=Lactobacillus agrestimuris TaxID=2941328 RepID=UPI002043F2C5|nr:hypothetical protein [Lactobacillus agrestimuris]
MKKNLLKFIATSSAALTLATPVAFAMTQNPQIVSAAKVETQKSVKMTVYKYSANHKSRAKSMAQGFVGTKAGVTIKNGKVTKLTLHVDGKNSPMGKGQNVDKIVKSLKINGVSGHKENISADNSSFDFVFSGKAFKNNGWAKMSVTINFGGNMTEQAWVKFGKVSGVKATKANKKKASKKVSKKSNSHIK